ncbi:type III toxin-antitoxin system ToxN/AbiQ family toxin [Ruminococcus sp.]|uniref:type III toxin-antitoxin system ToxN/AbiQ family toxin n=1 Tax=Ruminococcus sp. TaxID=41978 RepID=UPI0025DFFB6E|nr:type III toxin-antitoxin system ToxN/AbiQ family toxin [Ruminococcus sp.]MCR4639880.1 type III toxin-antitoxin system ToxN/AbiQ family toxin [Ruminococcus sp.]
MKQQRLSFYRIDLKYVRELAKKDDIVRSVSPQIGKEQRPFVGVIIICGDKKYCVPLSSPKPKHESMRNDKDFTKIVVKNKLIGVLNFNSMIPVDEAVIMSLDLTIHSNDTPQNKYYKILTKKQLNWCQQNQDDIVNKANKLYLIVTETPDKMINLTRRCCDFKKLEAVLEKYISK